MMCGYNSADQFSSTSYRTLIDFTADFGMVSKRSSFQYLLTSPVVSMLLGEKYIIARDGYIGNEVSLTEVKRASDNETTMYENNYCLPIGYMAADNMIYDEDLDCDTVFHAQNNVFSSLTGIDEPVYELLDPYSLDCENMEHEGIGEGLYSYKLRAGQTEGKIKVLSNVGILTTGFDYPALDTIVIDRPTKSLALYYQIVGRAWRPYNDKTSWIIDLTDNYERFGMVENLVMCDEGFGKYYIKGFVNGEWKQLTNTYFD